MISERGGLFGKLKERLNPKLSLPTALLTVLFFHRSRVKGFFQIILRRLLTGDTLFFSSKDSSVRRGEFKSLKELVESNSPYVALVQYNRVRWLSFSDCGFRLVRLLPLLVRYFEEQALDTSNRQEVRTKCRNFHAQLSEPRFQLFLFSLIHNHSKIKALLTTFIQPVTLDASKSVSNPANRLQQPDLHALINRFSQEGGPVVFSLDVIIMQFRLYQNDCSIDMIFSLGNQDTVKQWCQLYEGNYYKELASLAQQLLSISPKSVLCECGFSTMNYVKNEFRSVLTQENLNACMALGMMTSHTLQTFPFHTFLK